MIAGVIPASGLSSRMGTSKALLDAGGRTFLACVASALAEGGCRPILVVVRDPGGAEASEALGLGLEVVVNPDPREGPISSLRSAIRSLPEEVEGMAVCPVDHPLVSPSTVTSLLDAWKRHPAVAVVPTHEGRRGHPALLGRVLFPELLEEGLEAGARTVLRRHPDEIVEVPVSEVGILVDVDTMEDYLRYLDARETP